MDRKGDTTSLLNFPGLMDLDALVRDINLAHKRYFTGRFIILLGGLFPSWLISLHSPPPKKKKKKNTIETDWMQEKRDNQQAK